MTQRSPRGPDLRQRRPRQRTTSLTPTARRIITATNTGTQSFIPIDGTLQNLHRKKPGGWQKHQLQGRLSSMNAATVLLVPL